MASTLRTANGIYRRGSGGQVLGQPVHYPSKARRERATGHIRDIYWQQLCNLWGDCCLCCGCHEELTKDHVLPRSLGGNNSLFNLQPLCRVCNWKKGATYREYRPEGWREDVEMVLDQSAHPTRTGLSYW